jgi:hypothetical protein
MQGQKTKGHSNVDRKTEENLRKKGEDNSSGTLKFRAGM